MTTQSITVLGVPQLMARFLKAAALGEVAQHAAVDEIGQEVALGAQERAPVDTGALQDSIAYADGKVTADVPYAPFVEYGTSNTPAQPFMRPAADTVDDSRALEMAAAVMRNA